MKYMYFVFEMLTLSSILANFVSTVKRIYYAFHRIEWYLSTDWHVIEFIMKHVVWGPDMRHDNDIILLK